MKKLVCLLSTVLLLGGVPGESQAQHHVTKHKVKNGWSHKAKGAAIGAGSGAIIGGVAHGGKGAAIGTVVGAGTGYLIGRHRDRRHPGRRVVVKDKTVVHR